jgi:hypothetical protein
LRHQFPHASRLSPSAERASLPSSGQRRNRPADGGEAFRYSIESPRLHAGGCSFAALGVNEPSSIETPTSPAGTISDRMFKYFCRSNIVIPQ